MRTDSRLFPSALFAALMAVGVAGCVSSPSKSESESAPAPAVAERAPEPVAAAPAPESRPVCKEDAAAKKEAAAKSKTKKSTKTKAKEAAVEPDCVPATAAAPVKENAPPVAKAAASGGYDLSKNKPVTDSTKVESGQGTLVKGINDWQGEITGLPAANSRFTKLKIGMSQKQVADLVGEPTDQGAYVTGKAFIPFYFGSDKSRWEMTYKGQGRLIFSNQSGFGSGYYLTWIIHNANEGGYR